LSRQIHALQNKMEGAPPIVQKQYEERLSELTQARADLDERMAGYAERLEGLFQRYHPEAYEDPITELNGKPINPEMQPNGQIDPGELDFRFTQLRQKIAEAQTHPNRYPPVQKVETSGTAGTKPEAEGTQDQAAQAEQKEPEAQIPENEKPTGVQTYAYGKKPAGDAGTDVGDAEKPGDSEPERLIPEDYKEDFIWETPPERLDRDYDPYDLTGLEDLSKPIGPDDETLKSGLLSRVDELSGPRDYLRNPDLDPIQVKIIQQSLLASGIDPGPIDGKLGEKTMAAVEQYVEKFGIDENITFDELYDDMYEKFHHVDAEKTQSVSQSSDEYSVEQANLYAMGAARIESGALTNNFANEARPEVAPGISPDQNYDQDLGQTYTGPNLA
ncbi:MAG: peptidoglycan-binding domain-containing protein, partial [Pseudomonadota bacterium]